MKGLKLTKKPLTGCALHSLLICEILAGEALQWDNGRKLSGRPQKALSNQVQEWINPKKHFPEDGIKDYTKTKKVGDAWQSIDDDDDDDVISCFFEYLPPSSQLYSLFSRFDC